MTHKNANVLITGAGRGIGLALCERYLATGRRVFAALRNPHGARELWELERDYPGRFAMLELDVTSEADCARVAKELGTKLEGKGLDVLINNAGVLPGWKSLSDSTEADVKRAFDVNALGPLRVTRAMLPFLQAADAPVVVTLTSKVGSIADNSSGKAYAYRMSKAAANMFAKTFSVDHPKVISVAIHPGWVKTEMGGADAPTTTEESAEGIVKVIDRLKASDSGTFLDFKGAALPW